MTEKEFLKNIANLQTDIIQQLLDLLNQMQTAYCVIGGLAVNAYVEPVVSLDLALVITSDSTDRLIQAAGELFMVKRFAHSLILSSPYSDLRIQIQTDPRYQKFIKNATREKILGYEMNVAAIEDVLQGKIWAYPDQDRRQSKRQKDLADIFRIIEAYPNLKTLLPEIIKNLYQIPSGIEDNQY